MKILSFSFCAFASIALSTLKSSADFTELAGDWTLAELNSPANLRETYYNAETGQTRTSADSSDFAKQGEILVDAFFPDPLFSETRTFSINASGAVTGGETGTILSTSSNRILYSDGFETTTVFSNLSSDILIASSRSIDQQALTVCLKRPSSFAIANAEGAWHLISSINPSDISINTFEGALVDVFFTEDSSLVAGEIIFDEFGNFGGLFSGSMAGSSNGDITVTTPDGNIPFKINASSNLLATTLGEANEQEYILMVKKPSSLVTSDLQGTWRISTIVIPSSLTEVFYNNVSGASRQADSSGTALTDEILVDLFFRDPFELSRLHVIIESAGTISGSGTGTATANGDKSVSALFNGELTTLYPNADKTVMIGSSTSPDSNEIIVAVKTSGMSDAPKNFDELVDLKTIDTEDDSLIISWNSADNFKIEESTSLSGFSEITNVDGADVITVDTSAGGSRFFRVAEREAP